MLARCPACSELFAVIGSARTSCAFCGAAVEVEVRRIMVAGESIASPRATTQRAAQDGTSRVSIETLAASDVQKLAKKETELAMDEARRNAARMGRFRAALRTPRRTPWERRGPGRMDRFGETLHQVLTSPSRFFSELSADRIGGAASYAALLLLPTVLFQAIVFRHLMLDARWPWSVAGLELAPLPFLARVAAFTVLWVLYLACFYQAAGSLWSGRRLKLRGTIRATCFGLSPMVLAAVPVLGLVVGVAWSMVLHAIALRRHHGLPRLAALAIVVAPMLPVAWWLS